MKQILFILLLAVTITMNAQKERTVSYKYVSTGEYNISTETWEYDQWSPVKTTIFYGYSDSYSFKVLHSNSNISVFYNSTEPEEFTNDAGVIGYTYEAYFEGELVYCIEFSSELRIMIDNAMLRWSVNGVN